MNKIGSLANGPILGVFLLGILTKRANGLGAISGLILGFAVNVVFWKFLPHVSWPWWNMIGFVVCFVVGYTVSYAGQVPDRLHLDGLTYKSLKHDYKGMFKVDWRKYYAILAAWGVIITSICWSLSL